MSVIFLRSSTSRKRINSTGRARHGQYPIFGPIFRESRCNFCSQFRNRVKQRYSRGMPHYCPDSSSSRSKRRIWQTPSWRTSRAPGWKSSSQVTRIRLLFESFMNNTDASRARQSYLQLLLNESINVPTVMHREMAVDYGPLRRVYELAIQSGGICTIIRYDMRGMTRQVSWRPDNPSATTSSADAPEYVKGASLRRVAARWNCGRKWSGWTVGIEPSSLKACHGIRLSKAFLRYSRRAPVLRLITTEYARGKTVITIDTCQALKKWREYLSHKY